MFFCFFFQAEDGIRGLVRSRGLGDVYKRQAMKEVNGLLVHISTDYVFGAEPYNIPCKEDQTGTCLLYTSDAADDLLCVDLGGRRIIKKKNKTQKHLRQ